MRSFLRPFATLVAVPLFLCVGSCIYSGNAVRAASSLDTSSPAVGMAASPAVVNVPIPGPLRSFLRMAGISQEVPPGEVLPLLARNAYLLGYEEGTQTEFLHLVNHYLHQARELQILAGTSGTIQVASCPDAGALLKVLGYRLRQGCELKDIVLETANPTRAFLTIDSGFPLAALEEALQKGVPFTYAYPVSWVPVMFTEGEWISVSTGDKGSYGSVVDALTNDQAVARLYWALAKNDAETSLALERSPGLKRLLPVAPILDFYGSQISIRSGHVAVPGAEKAEPAWKELVGASPDSPGEFVVHLLAKDNGWLAAYFDALSRVSPSQQDHLVEASRLKHLYDAFRSADHEPPPARGVFRKAPDLLVLFTRLEWEPNGEMRIPGGLDAWKQILNQRTDLVTVRDWAKRARGWDRSEQLLEAMAAFSRIETDSGPLQVYLMLSEIDSGRPSAQRLSAETVRMLANRFSQLSSWYLVFTEFPELSDQSIARFVNVVDALDKIPGEALRGNALGTFQANVGLWQILARQGEIPKAQLDASWQKMVGPFAKISSSTQLFDAARGSLAEVLTAATGKADHSQDEIVDLLAGPHQESADGQQVHMALAGKIRSVLNDQRLVSFDTLFALNDGLDEMAHGKHADARLLSLAGELRDFELPRQIFSKSEKVQWAPKANNGRHAELQARIDLTNVIKAPGSHTQLEAARGQLAPLLRDALVGLNYAYYEPPGAQILHINPLFVRSHDFLGTTIRGAERLWQPPMLLGAGVSAGGGGYLMGSLADLSYSLASAEQDLIAPENIQALIWKELVPELLANASMTRWWNVSPNELHAVALYQRSGEELLDASVKNPQLRDKVVGILSDRMEPQRLLRIEQAMNRAHDVAAILPLMMPADTFYLGAEFHRKFSTDNASLGQAGHQLEDLSRRSPDDVSWERLSKDFGVPHPTLARTYARELLNVKPFPFFGGYSSRLFGESWESGNLYWARLADEMGYSPVMMNRLVPEMTRRMTAKIFATDLEDWPAMLRAMQQTGDELRQGKIVLLPAANAATSLPRTVGEANAQ
jgi:hypothetical protein